MRIIVIALDARDAAPEVEAFESRGDTVQLAATLGPWVEECDHGRYQLVLLVNPLTSGHHDVCRELRRRGATVPIVVAARSCCDSSDRVKAFKAGADDCIPPPYDVEELLLRSDALVRRSANAYDYPQQLGPIVLMPRTREAFIDGTRTPIPYREFELLSLLVRNADTTVSRSELLRRVWAASAPDSNVLEVHVRRVRAKLGRHERSLETVRGVGYRLITPVPASAPVHLATAT